MLNYHAGILLPLLWVHFKRFLDKRGHATHSPMKRGLLPLKSPTHYN